MAQKELYVEFVGHDYLYFETKKENIDDAVNELSSLIDRLGIIADNMRIKEVELRSLDGDVIEKQIWK